MGALFANNEIYKLLLLNSQAQTESGKINNLPKHRGAGPPEARAQRSCIRCIGLRPALDVRCQQQYGNNYNHWKTLDLVLDHSYFSFSNPNPNPNPTHLSKP